VPALLAYDGAGRALVGALKFANARPVARALGPALAALAPPVDVVTWAPTSPARRRQRGFDQAELLARAVARSLGVPCRCLLGRLPGMPQTGRTRAARLADPPVFVALGRPPPCVLVVDDVVTTGATVRAALVALREAGAREVSGLAAAATPAAAERVIGTYGR
jgi:predicted amidophosphoribosyltransferase